MNRRSETTSYNEAEGLMTFKEYCDDNLCISRQKARAKDVKSTQFAYSTPRYCSFEIELVEFTKVIYFKKSQGKQLCSVHVCWLCWQLLS